MPEQVLGASLAYAHLLGSNFELISEKTYLGLFWSCAAARLIFILITKFHLVSQGHSGSEKLTLPAL